MSKVTERPREMTTHHRQPFEGVKNVISGNSKPRPKIVGGRRYYEGRDFVSSLQSTDWADTSAALSFVKQFLLSDEKTIPICEPIYLGKDQGFFYYLQPGMDELHHDEPTTWLERPHCAFVKIVHRDGSSCPLRYQFGLGSLTWSSFGPDNEMSKKPDFHEPTPFAVGLDLERMRICLLLLPTFFDGENAVDVDFEDHTNVWDFLPSNPLGRPSFKVLNLMSIDDLGQSNPNFLSNKIVTQNGIDKTVMDQEVSEGEVNRVAMKAMVSRKGEKRV